MGKPRFEKGSPEAMAWKESMVRGKKAAKERRIAAARGVLGPDSTREQLEHYVKAEQSKARAAKAAAKAAAAAVKAASVATKEAVEAQDPTPGGSTVPTYADDDDNVRRGRNQLRHSALFGTDDENIPGGRSVTLDRIPSPSKLHRGQGITDGFLEEIPYDAFSKALVKARHGGGKYRAVVVDAYGNKLGSRTFAVGGKAKAFDPDAEPDEEEEGEMNLNAWEQPTHMRHHGAPPGYYPHYQRPEHEPPMWAQPLLQQWQQQQQPAENLAAVRRREEEKHERRMLAMQARFDHERECDKQRQVEEHRRQEAAAAAQMQMFTTMLSSQGNAQAEATKQNAAMMTTLLTALVTNKHDESPAVRTMATGMDAMTTLMTKMLETVSAAASGEDNRSIAERLIDQVGTIAVPMISRFVGEGRTAAAESTAAESTPSAQPQTNPDDPPRVVMLPGGVVITEAQAAEIMDEHLRVTGKDPATFTKEEVMAILEAAVRGKKRPPAQLPTPEPEPEPEERWMQASGIQYVMQAFRRGVSPNEALADALDSGVFSRKAACDLGDIYRRAGDKAGLIAILAGVFDLLKEREIEVPASFLLVFQGQEGGSHWLDAFLRCCSVFSDEPKKEAEHSSATATTSTPAPPAESRSTPA